MKVSHEVPICMLEKSREFNDYDYALVHLFEDNPDYFNFYKESVEMGREVILDNSLYELGKSYNDELYAKWITKLNPTYYIIPDAFNDAVKSMCLAISWISKYKDEFESKKIAVCHGKSFSDMIRCYMYYKSSHIDKIALVLWRRLLKSINQTHHIQMRIRAMRE